MKRRAYQKIGWFWFLLFPLLLSIVAFSLLGPPVISAEPGRVGFGIQDTPKQNQVSSYAIRANVDLVVLRATVRDHNGAPISGLAEENFRVYEDKVLQQIDSFSHEDVPVTVGLVVDSSGSMRPKRSEVIGAALAFVRSSNPEDQIFVVNFNEHVSLGLPASMDFTNDAARLETALSRKVITGMTALYDAIAIALDQLQKGKWDKKVLIVVSDGGDNASKRNLPQVISLVNQSKAVIYTIGVYDESDEDRNPRVLKQLSRASGGEAFFPTTLQNILPVCEQIAHDIRSQYTIAFVPATGKQDGGYRAIEVKAHEKSGGRRLSVITRAGYTAPSKLHSSGNSSDQRP